MVSIIYLTICQNPRLLAAPTWSSVTSLSYMCLTWSLCHPINIVLLCLVFYIWNRRLYWLTLLPLTFLLQGSHSSVCGWCRTQGYTSGALERVGRTKVRWVPRARKVGQWGRMPAVQTWGPDPEPPYKKPGVAAPADDLSNGGRRQGDLKSSPTSHHHQKGGVWFSERLYLKAIV